MALGAQEQLQAVLVRQMEEILELRRQLDASVRTNAARLLAFALRQAAQRRSCIGPAGQVALVVSEVDDAAVLWGAAPALMHDAVLLHNKILRKYAALNGGFEVHGAGDRFVFAFPTARKAVQWCCGVQRALLQAPWDDHLLELPQCRLVTVDDGSQRRPVFAGLRARMAFDVGDAGAELDPVSRRTRYTDQHILRRVAALCQSVARGGEIACGLSAFADLQLHDTLSGIAVQKLDRRVLVTEGKWEDVWTLTPFELASRQPPQKPNRSLAKPVEVCEWWTAGQAVAREAALRPRVAAMEVELRRAQRQHRNVQLELDDLRQSFLDLHSEREKADDIAHSERPPEEEPRQVSPPLSASTATGPPTPPPPQPAGPLSLSTVLSQLAAAPAQLRASVGSQLALASHSASAAPALGDPGLALSFPAQLQFCYEQLQAVRPREEVYEQLQECRHELGAKAAHIADLSAQLAASQEHLAQTKAHLLQRCTTVELEHALTTKLLRVRPVAAPAGDPEHSGLSSSEVASAERPPPSRRVRRGVIVPREKARPPPVLTPAPAAVADEPPTALQMLADLPAQSRRTGTVDTLTLLLRKSAQTTLHQELEAELLGDSPSDARSSPNVAEQPSRRRRLRKDHAEAPPRMPAWSATARSVPGGQGAAHAPPPDLSGSLRTTAMQPAADEKRQRPSTAAAHPADPADPRPARSAPPHRRPHRPATWGDTVQIAGS